MDSNTTPIKQRDVARMAGVSKGAVAFALGDDPVLHRKLRPETRQRIVAVANQLGYRPHRAAQLMNGVKSNIIGIVKPISLEQNEVESSFYISQAIQASGYGLLTNELLWEETGERRAVDIMLDAHVEGVLLLGISNLNDAICEEFQRLVNARIPIVCVDFAPSPKMPCITSNCRQGSRDLTNHLLAAGYRKLTMILPQCHEATSTTPNGLTDRLAGFREATAAAGLSESQAQVLYQLPPEDWRDVHASGMACVRQLVKSRNCPEVLLCNNDAWALGALAACEDAGLKVPQDIAITGFGDSMTGRYTRPALTTVALPTKAVAEKTVELLLKQMRGETLSTDENRVELPCQVVVRQTCGALI